MIADAHLHLEPELPVARLLEAMDAADVDQAVLIAAAMAPAGNLPKLGMRVFHACMSTRPLRQPMYRLATRLRPEPHPRPDNAPVFEASHQHPGRFLPFAFVNPNLGAAAHDELDRRLDDGARGVKLHPWCHDYRLPTALPILRRCEDAGLPVLVHLGMGPSSDVEAVLDACPRLRLVVAHAGIPHYEPLWRLQRLYFDIAGPLVSHRIARRLLDAVGPARIFYGSDGPVGLRSAHGHHYELPALPERVLGQNLASFLD
jgi:predicted TIM-barrel fold metal-dependent hydrolase